MTDTTFLAHTTIIATTWLQDINNHTYRDTAPTGTTVHAASKISNTPAGNIVATTVQAAINELDTEKAALAGSAAQAFATATLTTSGDATISGAFSLKGSYGAGGVISNFAAGDDALISNTTGIDNVAIGNSTLYSNTTGSDNTANGMQALYNNTTGSDNTAHGQMALYSNTTGTNNTANGRRALYSNTTGYNNTANGWRALYLNTTGYENTANGRQTLYSNTTGYANTASGVDALYSNTTGYYNTANGWQALYNNTTGSGNIGIGGVNSSGAYAPVFDATTENDRVVIGSTAVTNAYIQVAWTVVSDVRDKMNFAPVPHGIDFVKQLNPIAYQFQTTRGSNISNGPVRYGFAAQDILVLEGDNPVIIDNENPEKLRYNGESLVPVLVNALKEAITRIELLEKRLEKLESFL